MRELEDLREKRSDQEKLTSLTESNMSSQTKENGDETKTNENSPENDGNPIETPKTDRPSHIKRENIPKKHACSKLSSKNIKIAFSIQVFLNIIWNFIFFNQHLILLGLITIILLTIVVFYILFSFKNIMKTKSLLLLPYMIWLLIATSLNAYILINN